jgi:hypothetical protein
MRDLLRRVGIPTVLSQPWWQGVAGILTGLTFLATITVAVAVSCYVQQEEEQRHKETRAEFVASVSIFRSSGESGPWDVEIEVLSEGPAKAAPVRIDLEVGGCGVEASGELTTSTGTVTRDSYFVTVPPTDPSEQICHWYSQRVMVNEEILRGDGVAISQRFEVEPWRDAELLANPSLGWGGIRNDVTGNFLYGRLAKLNGWQDTPSLITAFIPSLDVVGDNVDFSQSWQFDFPPRWQFKVSNP